MFGFIWTLGLGSGRCWGSGRAQTSWAAGAEWEARVRRAAGHLRQTPRQTDGKGPCGSTARELVVLYPKPWGNLTPGAYSSPLLAKAARTQPWVNARLSLTLQPPATLTCFTPAFRLQSLRSSKCKNQPHELQRRISQNSLFTVYPREHLTFHKMPLLGAVKSVSGKRIINWFLSPWPLS